jgi:preprotein translocase subunit SecD
VDEGFEHAMSAIIDSNVTTALTAVILYLVGTGPVQGFAVTLTIGIVASMITAVFVTRTLFLIWLRRPPAMTTQSI